MTTTYLDHSQPRPMSRFDQVREWYRSRTRAQELRKAEDYLAQVVAGVLADIAAGKVPPEERAFLLRRLAAIRTELDGHIQAVEVREQEDALAPNRDASRISALSHA